MKGDITIMDKYGPAMTIVDEDAAKDYFDRCVSHSMICFGLTRDLAEETERSNLAYMAGYYDAETRERVERLFQCEHPVFGSIEENGWPTVEAAFQAGVAMAQRGES